MITRFKSLLAFAFIGITQGFFAHAGSSFSIPLTLSEKAYFCAKWGNASCVEGLLDGGLDVNSRVGCDLTMLHLAAAYGRADTVRLLLVRGADVNLRVTGEKGFFESCEFNPRAHQDWSAATFAKFADTPDDLFHAYLMRPMTWNTIVEAPDFDFDTEIRIAMQRNGGEYAEKLKEIREELVQKNKKE